MNNESSIDWGMLTAISTALYTILVAVTVVIIYAQVRELRQNRGLHAILTTMKEILAREVLDARRYIYENIPQNITDIADNELKRKLEGAEVAMTTFDVIGYLIQEGQLDPGTLLPIIWPAVWKCWKKSENLVRWAREKRGVETYLSRFEYLFNICEEYRKEHSHNEPVFY